MNNDIEMGRKKKPREPTLRLHAERVSDTQRVAERGRPPSHTSIAKRACDIAFERMGIVADQPTVARDPQRGDDPTAAKQVWTGPTP
jgi:hypothetical protein